MRDGIIIIMLSNFLKTEEREREREGREIEREREGREIEREREKSEEERDRGESEENESERLKRRKRGIEKWGERGIE